MPYFNSRHLKLIIIFFLVGCYTSKYRILYIPHIDSLEEGDKFFDSLKRSGCDTVIGYYDGCSGCIPGTDRQYYIFWYSESNWHLTKIRSYSRSNIIASVTPPIAYISENLVKIDTMQLKE